MAQYRIERVEYFQPVFGSDPQLYVYNNYLRHTTDGTPQFVQATSEYPVELDFEGICTVIEAAIAPDTLDDSCS